MIAVAPAICQCHVRLDRTSSAVAPAAPRRPLDLVCRAAARVSEAQTDGFSAWGVRSRGGGSSARSEVTGPSSRSASTRAGQPGRTWQDDRNDRRRKSFNSLMGDALDFPRERAARWPTLRLPSRDTWCRTTDPSHRKSGPRGRITPRHDLATGVTGIRAVKRAVASSMSWRTPRRYSPRSAPKVAWSVDGPGGGPQRARLCREARRGRSGAVDRQCCPPTRPTVSTGWPAWARRT